MQILETVREATYAGSADCTGDGSGLATPRRRTFAEGISPGSRRGLVWKRSYKPGAQATG